MTYTVNCSTLLTEFPLLERPARVQRAGFPAVEYWWPFTTAVPDDADIARFESAITDAGVQLTGLNFFAGDMPGGDRGLVSWPARASDYPLLTADDALRVIARVTESSTAKNVKLLADLYHLAVNGDDVAAVIDQHAAEFGHIQIADDPGRGAPGTGELPLEEWIARSRELGYEGYIGLEYKQSASAAFDWIAREARTR